MGRSLGHAGELRVPGRRSDARLLIQSVALAERALALLGWIQSASREIVLNPEVPSELEAADPAAATKSHLRFPVVGIGASAGGISATLEFLKHSPASSGMAFVVVLHLSPRHDSNAAAILQRATRMPVVQVTGTEPIEPNRVYVIAPALHLTMDDGKLRVEALERPRGRHVAIDLFFRTLARAHGERAIAVVLSGTGSDGSLGLGDVKAQGGVTLAQAPGDAEYDGMPSAAIASSQVDFVLPVAEIPAKLLQLWDNARRIRLPDAGAVGMKVQEAEGESRRLADEALRDVMAMLHARTGNDFRHYKRATVLRRIERRMQVTQQRDLPSYRRFVEQHPDETASLLQDLLISVTSFFRDRAAFEALERAMQSMPLASKPPTAQLRAWSVGCATGEEAYSIAMLLCEQVPQDSDIPIQVFASDIDERALAVARAGAYPEAILTDVPPSRLRQYFSKEGGGFRVRKALRERVVFSRHNVLRDPPFSRLDLVACRNLLIYLEREVQAQVLEMLHFALKPDGLLFLGSAETTDAMPDAFTIVDKRGRIYRANALDRPRRTGLRVPGVMPVVPRLLAPPGGAVAARLSQWQELHNRLMDERLGPSVVIDAQGTVVHSSAGASRYLRHPDGAPSQELIRLIRPELASALEPALMHARHTGRRVATRSVPLQLDEVPCFVQLSVRPGEAEGFPGAALVVFDEYDDVLGSLDPPSEDPVRHILEEEVRRLKQDLLGTVGDSEMSTEALRASNEELQSINEELRSTTEELETSKEELQSVNEELTTVNYELKSKVEESAKVNDDLSNLISSMEIATVFVDRAMRIKRFTPLAAEIFNVLPTDLDRPLLDLRHKLAYDELTDDVVQVLETLRYAEREVSSQDGHWYLVRISPYRSSADRIEGAILNFIDVTERRKAQMDLKARDERLRLVAESTRDYAIITLDEDGRVTSWNKGAELMFGYTEAEVLGDHFRHLFVPEDRDAGAPEEELRRARETGRSLDERWHLRKDGSRFYCSGITAPLEEGRTPGFAKIARDLTERQVLERQRDELLDAEKEIRRRLEAANAMRSQFLAIMSHELKNPLNLILLNSELLGRSPQVASSPSLSRAIDIIRRTVHGQSQIIDDLLDLSRLNTGKLALKRTEVQCRAVVDRIVEALQPDAQARGITLSASGDDLTVHADAVRVEQIVWNLVSNAMKFTAAGGAVAVSVDRDAECARLTVTDTGRGIEPEIIDKVFDMFAQGDGKPLTRREGGLGIGLALVRQLAELHGGRVEAASAGINKGAAFSVWLPLYDRSAGAMVQNAGSSSVAGKRVLLVDDSEETLEALSVLLQMVGAQVTTAASALAALEAAAAGFDIVLSDLAMPDMDGLQFIGELRRRHPDASWLAVAVTGFATSADAERALAAGFDAHLGKPLSLEDLERVVRRLGR